MMKTKIWRTETEVYSLYGGPKTKIRSDLVLIKKTFQGSKRRISSFSKEGSCWPILNIAEKINEVSLIDHVWEELDLVVTIPYR